MFTAELYAHMLIVVAFFAINMFGVLVITRGFDGVKAKKTKRNNKE